VTREVFDQIGLATRPKILQQFGPLFNARPIDDLLESRPHVLGWIVVSRDDELGPALDHFEIVPPSGGVSPGRSAVPAFSDGHTSSASSSG
jgi:hypothetical protein